MTVDSEFAKIYERHVGYVVAGDLESSLADMDRDVIPAVFEGVHVPRSAVSAFKIKAIEADGDRRIGEAVYKTKKGIIGLRSIWQTYDGRWLAYALENFPAAESDLS
ncbi:hypothetical protein CH299_27945 [Rhodococcus sp. 14-2686-1-2]|nr:MULTISPECIES: hypothetical protein [unclassified Rhodococcus (in: high G+C Gram-positive bacteria)]OZE93207.1 hypothetical protein CH301_27425 [Rhodococcus sp. 15-1189-1-1a]OZF08326.1 hypothetical protein CH299_27945 [Rhodococcus sp. 14-2686-1-2]